MGFETDPSRHGITIYPSFSPLFNIHFPLPSLQPNTYTEMTAPLLPAIHSNAHSDRQPDIAHSLRSCSISQIWSQFHPHYPHH
jgi:hypothetical protein|nr:hypothetical protein Q903MT_gene2669 [Picea sitchensis]